MKVTAKLKILQKICHKTSQSWLQNTSMHRREKTIKVSFVYSVIIIQRKISVVVVVLVEVVVIAAAVVVVGEGIIIVVVVVVLIVVLVAGLVEVP